MLRPPRLLLTCGLVATLAAGACTHGKPSPGSTASSNAGAAGTYRLRIEPAGFELPTPVEREVAVAANDTIYVAGGLDAAGRSVNGVFTLNPATGDLASVGRMPQAFHDAAGAFIGQRLFVFGGGAGEISDTVQAFDPESEKGAVVSRLPRAVSDLSAASVGSTVYLVGGYDGIGPEAAIYATTDGVGFRIAGRLPQGLRCAAVASLGKNVVVAGGMSAAGPVSDVYLFDTGTGRVSLLGRLPLAVGHAAAFAIGGKVYVAGGMDRQGRAVRQVVEVDPSAGKITQQMPLPSRLSDAAAVSDGSVAWLVGGWQGRALPQVLQASLERVVPEGASPSAPPFVDPAKVRPFAGLLLIADRGNNRLLVVDANKRITWRYPDPSLPPPPFPFYFPDDAFWVHHGHAILVNEEENDVLAEIAYPSGRTIWTYGHPRVPGSAPGYLNQPDDVYPYPRGGVVVADARNCRILFFDARGHATRQIGETLNADVKGQCVHDLPSRVGYPNGDTPLPNGDLLISELRGGWVSEITARGPIVWDLQVPGVTLPSDPQALPDGSFLAVDYNTPGEVVRFARDGRVLWSYGPKAGDGMISNPSLAAPLPNGLVAVCDDFAHRVLLIEPVTNRIVWRYGVRGRPGHAPGLLDLPDGFDLLLPGGQAPLHVDFSSPATIPGRP